jgi:AraC-like DNA-binding protein
MSSSQLIEIKTAIIEIAHAVGFNNSVYFSKSFKQAYGKSPKQFRQA